MFHLILLIICFCNGVIVYQMLSAFLISLCGNSRTGRLLKVFVAIPSGIAYTIFALNTALVSTNISYTLGLIVIFAPVGFFILLIIINYIKNGK